LLARNPGVGIVLSATIDRGIRLGLAVSIFGLGYVGSVSAACFASMGYKVIGVDLSRAKVEMMDSGRTPIIEARMTEMVAEANRAGLLHATTDATAAVLNSEVYRQTCHAGLRVLRQKLPAIASLTS
jgi:UDP-N-acetyl-D-mannosaminuronate dehydrogenase